MLAPVGGGADLVTGTSFAAAIVSGAIANLIHAAPDRSCPLGRGSAFLHGETSAMPDGTSDYGFGLVDANRLPR